MANIPRGQDHMDSKVLYLFSFHCVGKVKVHLCVWPPVKISHMLVDILFQGLSLDRESFNFSFFQRHFYYVLFGLLSASYFWKVQTGLPTL